MTKKLICMLIACMLLTAMFSGCGTTTPTAQPSSSSTSQGSQSASSVTTTSTGASRTDLNFGLISEPSSFDPVQTSEQYSAIIMLQIYDRLVEKNEKGEIVPSLAEKWSWNDDKTVLTFNLRKGVKFHNGDEMKAADVLYSMERGMKHKAVAMDWALVDHYEVVDDYTIKCYYKQPYGAALVFYTIPSHSIVCKAVSEQIGDDYSKNPIGTGPFKYVSRVSGSEIVMEANEDYWKTPAAIKKLKFKIIPDSSAATIALESGDIDFLSHAALDDKPNIESNSKLKWYETGYEGLVYTVFNLEKGVFANNEKLRRAVAYGINVDDMIKGSVNGYGSRVFSQVSKNSFGYTEDLNVINYDLAKAKAMLAEAGYKEGELSVEIKTCETPTYIKPSEILQSQLQAMGINAKLTKMERAAWISDVCDNHDYDLSIMTWCFTVTDADYCLYSLYHSSQLTAGDNFARCNDPDLDALLTSGRSETDTAKRLEIYKQAQQLMWDKVYTIPMFNYMAGVAANKDLKGVKADPLYFLRVYDYSW